MTYPSADYLYLPFYKYEACGNDFVLVDCRRGDLFAAHGLCYGAVARHLCQRRRAVGADGMLLLTKTSQGDDALLIFNADGSEAEFCGNGLRCAALHLFRQNGQPSPCLIATRAGLCRCQHLEDEGSGSVIVCALPPPTTTLGTPLHDSTTLDRPAYLVDSGVPHLVLLMQRDDAPDIAVAGAALRRHCIAGEAGANVDFCWQRNASTLFVRTYERGVEGETPSCGSGAVASAIAAAHHWSMASPITILTAGNDALTVTFTQRDGSVDDVTLRGKAHRCFEGCLPLPLPSDINQYTSLVT